MPGIDGLCRGRNEPTAAQKRKHRAAEPSPWGQHSYALALAQPSFPSAHLHITIYTTSSTPSPSTQHQLHNTTYTTSSTQHDQHTPSTLHHQQTSSTHLINTTSSTHHHLHNTIYTTPSTQHHLHNTIYTTSSHTGRCSTWSTAILPLLPHSC